jgi:hypothetical protein
VGRQDRVSLLVPSIALEWLMLLKHAAIDNYISARDTPISDIRQDLLSHIVNLGDLLQYRGVLVLLTDIFRKPQSPILGVRKSSSAGVQTRLDYQEMSYRKQ